MRLGLAAVGILLALVAAGRFVALDGERQELTAWLEKSGQPVDPRLERELARELDGNGLAVRAMRASLAREISALAHADPATAEGDRQASAERLAETARRAGAALAESPASWEAAMVLGAATYMSGSQARDSRLFTAHERWEEPLQVARRLAPAKREAMRFLTTAYLEIWPALSPPKREIARRLVAEMLRDPEDREVILPAWMNAVGDRRTALSVVPADARAWEKVQRILAGRGDWEGFSTARDRWDRALFAQLSKDLTAADARVAAGDLGGARALYLSVLERARPDLAYRDLVAAALNRCPPGPVGRDTSAILARQLEWTVERCLLADCTLPPQALKRLALLAGQAAPPQEATALLLSGDMPGALALERRAEGWSDAWAPYLLLKARTLIGRQQLAAAATALDLVPRSWWERPSYWRARRDLARAGGDDAGAARAGERLKEMIRRSWPATAWTWRGDNARLEMLTDVTAAGIDLDLSAIPASGAVVELRLDGELMGTLPARPVLALDLPLAPGLHLLEVDSLGAGVVPGATRLR